MLKGLKKADAQAFIYIGGNDTSGTQQILTDASGGSIAFVHAPKTIDNDLMENDHTPGFISAAEFVAGAFLSVDLDFRALPGVYVAIVMGRHAGFLTAASAAWRLDADSGPHLIYVPERAFSVKSFIDDVKRTLDKHKRCVVAVSEGVQTAEGTSLVESIVGPDKVERDAHGNVKLSGSDLNRAFEHALAEGLPGKRARVDALGYMPRGYVGAINKVEARKPSTPASMPSRPRRRAAARSRCSSTGKDRAEDRAAAQRRSQDPSHARGFHPGEGTGLTDKGMAYLERLVPKKFAVAKPFV